MSSTSPENPYAATALAPPENSLPFTGQIQYLDSFRYVTTSPNWMLNVLLGFLCQLVPLVGPIVFLGYMFDTTAGLVNDSRRSFPDFDFNRLKDYLMRGLWPFLVALVASIVVVPLVWIFALVFVVGPMVLLNAARIDGTLANILVPPIFLGDMVLFLAFMAALQVIMFPMILSAGLAQDLGAGFNLAFVRDFQKRVWKEIILAQLFMMAASLVLFCVGFCVFVVGAYLAMSFCMLASAHLNYQVYALYLARGGKPIPMKPEPLPG